MFENKNIIREAELARRLNIHRSTLWRWRKNGGLPYCQINRTVFFSLETLRDYFIGQQKQTTNKSEIIKIIRDMIDWSDNEH